MIVLTNSANPVPLSHQKVFETGDVTLFVNKIQAFDRVADGVKITWTETQFIAVAGIGIIAVQGTSNGEPALLIFYQQSPRTPVNISHEFVDSDTRQTRSFAPAFSNEYVFEQTLHVVIIDTAIGQRAELCLDKLIIGALEITQPKVGRKEVQVSLIENIDEMLIIQALHTYFGPNTNLRLAV